jgi:hypothetical protein
MNESIRAPRANLTIKEAAAQARRYAHGSFLHSEARQVLLDKYRAVHPNNLNPSLEQLWGWVDGYLEMEQASIGPTPLG